MTSPEIFMQRCIELASNGLGMTAPNPMVGCVIVQGERIIGEGFHRRFGEAHAEVNAIRQVIAQHGEAALASSTLYVSLEPCSHSGKTPPCTDLIIEKHIPRVVIGCIDPNALVNGSGAAKLQQAGISVQTGVLEKECRELNRRFFTFHEKKRPYIILKWAQSLDGFIAPKNPAAGRWISNEYSRKLTHKWRSEEQAILVGSNTAIADNPSLTVRDWSGENPVRIVIDPDNTLPETLNVLDENAATLVFTSAKSGKKGNAEWLEADLSGHDLRPLTDELHRRSIQSVIIEGGTFTLSRFIEQQLWDEARIFIAGRFLNEGIPAPAFSFSNIISEENILNDRLYFIRNN